MDGYQGKWLRPFIRSIEITDGSQLMLSENGDTVLNLRWYPGSTHICHSKVTDLPGSMQERDLICVTVHGDDSLNFTENSVDTCYSTIYF